MIRVTKGAAPQHLIAAGMPATAALRNAYDATPNDFRAGTKKLKFKPAIFGHQTVRQTLALAQYGKCCYCEVKIPVPYALQHIEHYRPKSQSRQSRGSNPVLPGYYWLAYDWTNLFLSCHFCNSSNKGDLFPLSNEALRTRDHHGSVAQESPLVLCPDGAEDPEQHIEFHDEIPKAITQQGKSTIVVLGLDHPKHESRLETLARLRMLRDEIIVLKSLSQPQLANLIRDKRAQLLVAQRPSSPFSSMAKHYIRNHPIP